MKHVIMEITYYKGIKEPEALRAPMTCICGWSGPSNEHKAHRLQAQDQEAIEKAQRHPARVK